ncbi:type 2 lanthipeptide synthetase LanM family protein [Amycolatopsis vastitatis]|uniref:type 2 lanthipeptide synthetase LanM family protein n=1 Tax=Amycolatopsis vastitatis TaxID=1905142 RepID=UPI00196B765E|nr:type 2 lanthipeptide synthetase LanM family protein [Amycolatopsis vastitatis]
MLTEQWYRGLSLTERLPAGAPADPERGARRLARWRRQRPFDSGDWLARRLAADGITEADLAAVLGEDDTALHTRLDRPAWLADVAAFAEPPSPGDGAADGFLALAEPLVRQACAEVTAAAAELAAAGGPLDPAGSADLLRAHLLPTLPTMVERTLALELNVARLRGETAGDTPQARYVSFVRRLREPATVEALFAEYPLLGRLLAEHVRRQTAVHVEFLRRLTADWADIRKLFAPADPGLLSTVEANLGDRHRGGRAVLVAVFSGGFRLVYKPKSLAVDVHFQQLLEWLGTVVPGLGLRTLTVLDRGEYGWTEFCARTTCHTEEEVARFYRRLGAYLALMYGLGGTDMHYENLIAAGEHPVVVDLESLFQPNMAVQSEIPLGGPTASLDSVLRVGLLPQRSWGHTGAPGLDLSGLGYQENQLSPRASQYWAETGTDRMRTDRKRMATSGGHNRPTLLDAEVNVLDYADELIDGFRDTYRGILENRAELLAPDGPLARFAADEIRVIVRPTHIYSLLLRESFHPDLLRDGLDRDRFFDKLWVSVDDFPYLGRVIAAERADLWRGDVPIFVTTPGSVDVRTSAGERVPGFLERPSMEVARERIERLSAADLDWQTWIVRGSLTSLALGDGTAGPATYGGRLVPGIAGAADYLAAARTVGNRLEKLAVRRGDDLYWLGLTAFQEQYWDLTALDVDLYGGVSGIVLFLAYLGHVTGEDRYTTLAEGGLSAVRRLTRRGSVHTGQLGAFSGLGSPLYLLTHLGVLWDRPELFDEALELAAGVAGLVDADTQLDVLGGAAGCIGALAALHRHRPDSGLVDAVVRCGDHLLATALPAGGTLGWPSPMADRPLTGFAHGAAGVGWALATAAELGAGRRFADAAARAIGYERAQFRPDRGNWPDLRAEDPATCMTAWCHGAVGIGLGRLALPGPADAERSAEITAATTAALATGFGANHSLCHGDFGSLDLLLAAGHDEAADRGAAVLGSIDRHGWRCGVPTGAETPGLMAGLAGIGYGLLRAADPAHVPSVLALEPPRP